MAKQRDDFSDRVRGILKDYANDRCCLCQAPTSGPGSTGPVHTGRAAHITAASPGGPRYDPNLTREERSHADNGIWLCAKCGDIVDDDVVAFTVEILKASRARHYERVQEEQRGFIDDAGLGTPVTDALRHWPSTIRNHWLVRPELDEIAERLLRTDDRSIMLLGPAGIGKSAILAKLVPLLENAGSTVFPLRLDRLPRHVSSALELGRWAGLSTTIPQRLQREAKLRPVVLVVDQLDQLSELTDRDTRRLETVLQMLLHYVDIPNVRLVAACRDFDFRRDARFRRLNGLEVLVPPLPVDVVAELLRACGVDPASLPLSLLEVLRIPQPLKVFLELRDDSRPLLSTYHEMLETLWADKVATPSRKVAATRLVQEVTGFEEALVPIARLDDVRGPLLELVHEGLARQEGLAVGFTHQTILDFARARSFVEETEDLLAYTREREGTVFVRPTLWNALHYMRSSRSPAYARCVSELLRPTAFREHVRILTAEFIGQIADPTPQERLWFLQSVQDRTLRRATLQAVTHGAAWIQCLGPERLRRLVRDFGADIGTLFLAAVPAAQDEVLACILEFDWLRDEAAAGVAAYLLRFVTWDPPAIETLRALAQRGPIPSFELTAILPDIAQASPSDAISILAIAMSGVLSRSADAAPRTRADSALALLSGFPDPHDLARSTPKAFLSSLLPFLHNFVERDDDWDTQPVTHRYRWPYAIAYPREPLETFFNALCCASAELARSAPTDFISCALLFHGDEADAVQAVLAHGYGQLPASHVSDAVAYATDDPRRLTIAGTGFPDRATMELFEALGPKLGPAEAGRLEESVFEARFSELDSGPPDSRRRRLRYDLERRSRLLLCIPQQVRSLRARQHIASHPTEITKPEERKPIRFEPVPGPMSSERMALASDHHILKLYEELTDETEWRHPRSEHRGGSIEASRALKELAKSHPARAAQLVRSLRPSCHERPVGYVLEALAEVRWDHEAWVSLVLEFDARGFAGPEFRLCVADGIYIRARAGEIDDRLVALLEKFLEEGSRREEASGDDRQFFGAPESRRQGAQLRSITNPGYGVGAALPEGDYRLMRALDACLMHEQRDPGRWLANLERHLTRPRRGDSIRCWRALAHQLDKLRGLEDRARVARFYRTLFEEFPEVLASEGGAHLLLRLCKWGSREDFKTWIDALRSQSSWFASQLAGELLSALDLLGKDPESVIERLQSAPRDEAHGIALLAAEWWTERDVRGRATDILLAALALGDWAVPVVLHALDQWEVAADTDGVRLLEATLSNPGACGQLPTNTLEQVPELLPDEPTVALRITLATLDAVDKGRPEAPGWFDVGPAFTSVALTLQRTAGFQEQGLELFERLIRLGLYGVKEALFDLDRRPGRPPRGAARRTNRKRRR